MTRRERQPSTVARAIAAILGSLVLAVCAVWTLVAADGARAASTAGKRARQHPASQAAFAQQLTVGVAGARTTAGRARAILAVLSALHIGVYKPSGRPVQRGAERGARDLYLYDFEVTAIANALAARQVFALSDLGDLLARVGVKPGGAAIPADQLDALLRAGIKAAAASPNAPWALLPLLVRDLGRRDKPASDPALAASATARFDALAYMLLSTSFLGTALRHDASSAAPRVAVAAAGGCPEPKPDPSDPPQLGEQALEWWGIKKLSEIPGRIGKKIASALEVKELVDTILAGLHGSVLAYGLQVKSVVDNVSTHYGPAGHAPQAGMPMNLQVRVMMLDDLGEEKIQCLALAGIKLPRKGPVPDVPILWQLGAQGNLLQHGTTNPSGGLLGPTSNTDQNGIATLTFTPKDEILPGLGLETHDTGVVDGIALWQDAFGNSAGLFGVKLSQYMTPKFDGVRWDVGYHNQNGLLAAISAETATFTCAGCSGGFHYLLQAKVPITKGIGGSDNLAWTGFAYHFEEPCPNSGTYTWDGENPLPGSLALRQVTTEPTISTIVDLRPATYVLQIRGCGADTRPVSWDPLTQRTNDPGVTRLPDGGYSITGWTPGSGSVFATRTIALNDGTLKLEIDSTP